MSIYAENLRRVMVREGLSFAEVVAKTKLDGRTVRSVLNGRQDQPHSRTLHRLAEGLNVSADELCANPTLLARRTFDRRANPVVEEVAAAEPETFAGWNDADFDELASRFGVGGELTRDGALAAARAMNVKRRTQEQVALLMETEQAELVRGIVEALYRQVVIVDPIDAAPSKKRKKKRAAAPRVLA